jgi:hypothetical protein
MIPKKVFSLMFLIHLERTAESRQPSAQPPFSPSPIPSTAPSSAPRKKQIPSNRVRNLLRRGPASRWQNSPQREGRASCGTFRSSTRSGEKGRGNREHDGNGQGEVGGSDGGFDHDVR